jgi:trans-2,3-dihydro-3-hydroxyanthranilate isomerase
VKIAFFGCGGSGSNAMAGRSSKVMAHKFIIADVFTETPFGGNQLAVFPDAAGITDADMQAYAREINFCETTFVLPPRDPRHTFRVRIFSPKTEMPFAGHPTIGTAAVLREIGRIPGGTDMVVFEEGIGPISVALRPGPAPVFTRLILTGRLDRPDTAPGNKAAADVLSLEGGDVLETWYGSVGVPFTFVHMKSKQLVDRATLNRAVWSQHFAKSWAPQLFFFSGDLASGSHLYARMFAPALGVEEDPATGSAGAALAATLVERLADGEFKWAIDQGVSMGRPSRIEASAAKKGGKLASIEVGGSTVIVGEGSMTASIGS